MFGSYFFYKIALAHIFHAYWYEPRVVSIAMATFKSTKY